MGLFSSKKETYVGTSVSRVIQDDRLPSAIRNGALLSLFQEEDLVESVINEMVGSIGLKTERMYDYAKRSYPFGLPSATIIHNTSGESVFRAVLTNLTGYAPEIEYFHYGPINNLHVGWVQLFQQYGYNAETNQIDSLTLQKQHPVFLEDMVVVLTQATYDSMEGGFLDQWGPAANGGRLSETEHLTLVKARKYSTPSLVEVSPAVSEDRVRVHYRWQEEETEVVEGVTKTKKVTKKESFLIPFSGYSDEEEYFQARYMANGVTRMFTYQDGEGSFPELDGLFNTNQSTAGTYFPFGYLRHNKTKPTKDSNPQEWAASKKLFNYLGINYGQMVDAVHENADIADVEQAIMTLAVPANTTNEIEQRYLFDFFKRFYVESRAVGVPLTGLNKHIGTLVLDNPPTISMVIEDSRFKMSLGCQGIFKKFVNGVLGPVGSHHSAHGTKMVPETFLNPFTDETTTEYFATSAHYYRKQVNAAMYEEYEIVGLRMTYRVWGKYTAVGDEEDKILLIPLDRRITRKYSILDREELYARSLHYVFNSREVVKVKWYQQEWFGEVLFIAAIVIAVVSLGSGSGVSGWLASLATMTTAQIIYTIAIAILKALVIRFAFKMVVKMAGPEVAAILAAVAILYGAYDGYQAGGIADAPWASDLLTVGTGLMQGVTDVTAESYSELLKEMESFKLYAEEQEKSLKTVIDLLSNDLYINPLYVIGESPNDYYQRTVHSGNIGLVGIEAVTSYVEMSLSLPTISNTIGEIS